MRRRFIYAILELVAHDAQATLCHCLDCAECIREDCEKDVEREWECPKLEQMLLPSPVKIIE